MIVMIVVTKQRYSTTTADVTTTTNIKWLLKCWGENYIWGLFWFNKHAEVVVVVVVVVVVRVVSGDTSTPYSVKVDTWKEVNVLLQ